MGTNKSTLIKVTWLDGSISIISRERYASIMRGSLRKLVRAALQVRGL